MHIAEDEEDEMEEASWETIPTKWYKHMDEQVNGVMDDEATPYTPPKVPKYPKAIHIIQTYAFSRKDRLGKEGQGITQVIEL